MIYAAFNSGLNLIFDSFKNTADQRGVWKVTFHLTSIRPIWVGLSKVWTPDTIEVKRIFEL